MRRTRSQDTTYSIKHNLLHFLLNSDEELGFDEGDVWRLDGTRPPPAWLAEERYLWAVNHKVSNYRYDYIISLLPLEPCIWEDGRNVA